MSYAIRKVNQGVLKVNILVNNNSDVFCPYKTRIPIYEQGLTMEGPLQIKAFMQQGCDDMCPLFELIEDKKVKLHCCNRIIEVE